MAKLLVLACLILSAITFCRGFGKEWTEFEGIEASKTRGLNHQRFPDGPTLNQSFATKEVDLTLLISITSAPGYPHLRYAVRRTWALPCVASPACEYRFFIDVMNTSEHYAALKGENDTYGDIVIRGQWCEFMETRHTFEKLNFGNVFKKHWVYGGAGVPYYQFRGLFKIDWKICHSHWARYANRMARYHLYTEDDSYVCTENLLHQLSLLRRLNITGIDRNWRIGDPKWDGYDDNLTLMTKDIAEAFTHYPEPGFNCSRHADDGDPAPKAFLSWGNSWQSKNCNWRQALYDRFNLSYITPWLWTNVFQCPGRAPLPMIHNTTYKPSANPTPAPTLSPNGKMSKIDLLCSSIAGTVHNHDAGRFLHYEKYVEHMCEFVFVIHKVQAHDIDFMWDNATAHDYHNMTSVFIMTGTGGWHEMIRVIKEKESNCHLAANKTDCLRWRQRSRHRGLREESGDSDGDREAAKAKERGELMRLYYPRLFE